MKIAHGVVEKQADRVRGGNLSSRESVVELDREKDAVVMVLFPVGVWDRVRGMAKRMGVEPAEVVGGALKLMEERIVEVSDGA